VKNDGHKARERRGTIKVKGAFDKLGERKGEGGKKYAEVRVTSNHKRNEKTVVRNLKKSPDVLAWKKRPHKPNSTKKKEQKWIVFKGRAGGF